MTRYPRIVGLALLSACSAGALALEHAPAVIDPASEQTLVEQWRAARVADLTGDQGWLTLVGLFWLDKGDNSFGRASGNKLVLNHPALAPKAGKFVLDGGGVHFVANRGSGITHAGQPVTALDMVPDTQSEPTVISSGALRIWIIERSGKLGVRIRDLDSPRRREFKSIDYYPVDTAWVFDARFEPYEPHRHIPIINILGLESDMDCPGTLVFQKDGQEWRLDALLEDPHDDTLFVMFADRTNGDGSYGGGRFLRVPLPAQGTTQVDFNKAYNPPCAFNDFATCPLPPPQNRLALRVESGEKAYGKGH
ncbi:MAG: DUF1684 domain-containing protein [Sinobacteraceae bacterium]|nr:DUF1684 domain-containing protein [Nevskiaceae bacterium]